METAFDELLVEPFLHLSEQEGCYLGSGNCFLARTIKFDFAELHRTCELHHRQVVVAAEYVEADGVTVELQLGLKRVEPTEFKAFDALPSLAIPVESVENYQ